MYRIFIVEDDEIISEVLKKNLSSWGYDVSCAEDFSNIIQEFVRRDPQLVLLDLKLPFYNGFHWCEEIRRISQVPVIFISSEIDEMTRCCGRMVILRDMRKVTELRGSQISEEAIMRYIAGGDSHEETK